MFALLTIVHPRIVCKMNAVYVAVTTPALVAMESPILARQLIYAVCAVEMEQNVLPPTHKTDKARKI